MELFNLLRSSITGEKLSAKELAAYSSVKLSNLVKVASKHDLVHLLALAIKQNDLTSKVEFDVQQYIYMALYRHERMNYDFEMLCNALEKAKISFMPLKGSVIRKYYPEAWMRTSCDIDILVHAEDLEKAVSILINEYGYTYQKKSSHDISLYSPRKVHIELHYSLIEERRINQSAEVLLTVWEQSSVRDGFSFWFEMSDEMFYFYHIAHMSKHFVEGGCGIRSFIDLWILENIQDLNMENRNHLLADGGLLKFANIARKQCKIWFGDQKEDALSKQIEDYILRGGTYGNNKNRIMIQQQKRGGQLNYALSKIFIPYDVIKYHYPILQKYRCLTPIMQIRRWCKLIFCGHLKRSLMELQYNNSITSTEAENAQTFLKNLGL